MTEIGLNKLKEEALKYVNINKHDKAVCIYNTILDCLNKSLDSNPSSEKLKENILYIKYSLIECYLNTGNYSLAIAECQIILNSNTEDIKTFIILGQIYLENNEVDLATNAIETISIIFFKNFNLNNKILANTTENNLNELKDISINKNIDYEKLIYDIKNYNNLKINVQKKILENELNKRSFKSYNKINNLITWLKKDSDSYFSKINVNYYSNTHRGIFSKRQINKDELFVVIPKNKLITLENAKECSIGLNIINKSLNLKSPKHCFLSCFILQEKYKEKSIWEPYINSLPDNYENFPIFFNKEILNILEGSSFINLVNEKLNDIRHDYNLIYNASEEFREYSFKVFCEIRMAVSSRIFGIKINGKKTDTLCPIADLLNHKRPRQTQWFYSDTLNSFVIQALDNIKENQEIFDSYGKKCNSRFFLNYGFIVDNNESNEYPLYLELPKSSDLYSIKAKLIDNIFTNTSKNYNKKLFKLQKGIDNPVFYNLISFLRFVYFEGKIDVFLELVNNYENSFSSNSNNNNFYLVPYDILTEKKCLNFIVDITQSNIKKYKESNLDKLKCNMLNDIELTENKKNCYKIIINEIEILKYFNDFALYNLKLLDINNIKQIKEKIKIDYLNKTYPYESYLNEVVLQLIKPDKLK